jgi:Flp pilus assembly pilin Flp
VKDFLRDLIRDESGQDLVEYALLTVFVAMVGALGFRAITEGIGTAYPRWDTQEQNLWMPQDPPGFGSP